MERTTVMVKWNVSMKVVRWVSNTAREIGSARLWCKDDDGLRPRASRRMSHLLEASWPRIVKKPINSLKLRAIVKSMNESDHENSEIYCDTNSVSKDFWKESLLHNVISFIDKIKKWKSFDEFLSIEITLLNRKVVNIFFKIKVNKEINTIYFPFELKFSSI